MLEDYRVVDLTDERGSIAGHILATLGADVTLVEPPGGSSARRRGPFVTTSAPTHERSLTFWAWNRGKRGVMLDATTAAGQEALDRLVAGADVVIESGARPVDLDIWRARHPSLVTVSISAYGERGPKAGWPATDLTAQAAGCQLAISGDEDRAPVRTAVPQAFLHASSDAACGALLALAERSASGRGQHVEVSAMRSIMQATQSQALAVPLGAAAAQRVSGGVKTGGLDIKLLWPCRDGYASVTFLFGSSAGPFTKRLMDWIHEEGFCDDATRNKDWLDYANQLYDGREPISEYNRLKEIVATFCATKTKAELLDAACERSLLIAPVSTPSDLLDNAQLNHRGYFEMVHDEAVAADPVPTPGSWFWSSALDKIRLGRAPRLGEHNDDLSAVPRRAVDRPDAPSTTRRPPLDGVKVLDLSWAMAGPAITRAMADFGADVIRVETTNRLDVARTIGPFVNDQPGNDASGLLFNMTAGKRSVGINLRRDLGRGVLDDLVRWADVVVESFSPTGRRALGLDYERLSEIRPGLVMLSTCLCGQTGPLERYAGFGTMGSSLGGFVHMTGWPDRPPCGPFGAYTDYPSPRFALSTLLAAMDHRRRTGDGQYIDFSQIEASIHFLAPSLLDQAINGTSGGRSGNRDDQMVPHGVYRTEGTDSWIAIACRDDADWAALARTIGHVELQNLPLDDRRRRADELDGLIEAWTSTRDAAAATAALIESEVPAHPVQNSGECMTDPQLREYGHWLTIPHPEHGTITVEANAITLSDTPAVTTGTPPVLGQDTISVLLGELHYEDTRLGDLLADGALD
ncbi:MAG: CoA transferase [Desertimonas sp.]